MTMRIIDTGPGNAAFNMAMDSVLAHRVATGALGPVFRMYTWENRALSIGFSQDAQRVLNLERCRNDRMSVVRRPTGGRAVLHGNDLSYTLVISENDKVFGGTLRDSCRQISMMICDSLKLIGINAEVGKHRRAAHEDGNVGSPPCFSSATRFEITVNGRKIAGIAQRRMNGILFQQGTILMHADQGGIGLYLAADDTIKTVDIIDNCIGVCDVSEADTGIEIVKDALSSTLSIYYNGDITVDVPIFDEIDEANRLSAGFLI